MGKRKAAEAAAEARRGVEADSDEGAAAAAAGAAGAEVAAQQPLAVELEGVWWHIGRGLRLPADADAAACQAALLRWAGFEWGRDGALTVEPQGFNPSPLALHLLPVDVATCVLSLLPVHDRLRCAGVSRAWRTLARLPAAWARISWPFKDGYSYVTRGLGGILPLSLAHLAHARHGSPDALLSHVLRLDVRAYARSPNEEEWVAVVARCPSLQELRVMAYDGMTLLSGEEMGASPGALLAVLRAAPALRVLDAHVDLRPNRHGDLNAQKVEQLRTLLAHPRASVATLSVRVSAGAVDAAYHKALGDVLESAEAASLRSVSFLYDAAPLAYAVAGALGRSASIQVRLDASFSMALFDSADVHSTCVQHVLVTSHYGSRGVDAHQQRLAPAMQPSVAPRVVVESLEETSCPLLRPGKPPLEILFLDDGSPDSEGFSTSESEGESDNESLSDDGFGGSDYGYDSEAYY